MQNATVSCVVTLADYHYVLVVNLPLLQNHSPSSLYKSCLLAFDKNSSINIHLNFHFTFNFISYDQLYSWQTHHQVIVLEQLLHMKLF